MTLRTRHGNRFTGLVKMSDYYLENDIINAKVIVINSHPPRP